MTMGYEIKAGELTADEIAEEAARVAAEEAQRPIREALAALAELDAEYIRRRPRWDEDATAGREPFGKADYDTRRAQARAAYEAARGAE